MRPARPWLVSTIVLLLAISAAAASPAPSPTPSRAPAATAAPAPVKVTSVEGITEYALANGLRVLLFPDPTKATVTVNVTYLVGSRYEGYGETGMAHLLEHLMFKGSPKHTNIPQELTSHGARPNGTTSFDRTNYFETFQANDENLKWALELEADRMVNSFIARKDLDSEMTVVRNEFEAGENNPQGVVFKRVLAAAYQEHNYSHLPIGARSDIENVPIDRLQAFYRNYYQPDNAVLLVAGKFEEAPTLALIQRTFGPIPRPTRVLPKLYTSEPVQDGEKSVTLRRVGDVQFVVAAYHTPAGSHPDAAALQLLAFSLGDTPTGRLHKALVETKKAAEVFAFQWQLADPGLLMAGADVRQESSLEDARKALLDTIDAAATTAPVTSEELERARTKALKDIALTLNQSEQVGLQLSEFIAKGDWRLFFLHRDRIKQVKLEDVQRVARAYLKPSNRTVGLFFPTAKPDRSEVPAAPDLAAALKGYRGEAAVAAGEAFDPSPAAIESRVARSKLDSGLKLALLPKKTRGETVVATLTLRFGDPKSLMNKSAVADLTADMLMRGTAKHTRQQIKDEFDRLKARVSVSGGPTQAVASVETVRASLAPALRLLGEVLREPAFPEPEFEQLRQENLSAIEQQKSEPQSMGSNAFQRHMSPYPKGDVRYTATPDETIAEYKGARLAEVRGFYRDYYGGSVGELAVVGDFDPAEVGRLAAELFGSWKSPRPFERVPRPFQAVEAVNQSIEAPDKANAFFLAGLNLNVRDDDPDYPALTLGNYMLGGGFLNSRLASRIRQKEGLSYGVGSQLQASPLDKAGSFVTFAIYAPQNVAKLEAAFREELERALKDGFTDQEVKEAKSGFLQGRQVGRAQDAALARTLAQDLYIDRTLQWDAQLESRIAALAPSEIQAAMRRHIDPTKITIVKAGNFAGGPAASPAAPVPIK